MSGHGLFVGAVTLDLAYLTAGPPNNNQKVAASDYVVAAGGPATNAAVAFKHLGNQATLLGVIGSHPIGSLIRAELESHPIEIVDLDPTRSEPPPMSSIIVTEGTGERAIVSLNTAKTQVEAGAVRVSPQADDMKGAACPQDIRSLRPDTLHRIDIVLIDGHQMAVGQEIAKLAQSNNIPVVIDGGSWKPGLEKILPLVDYVICSANFYPPDCDSSEAVISYLSNLGIQHIAITHGEKPIQYISKGSTNWLEVTQTQVIDTNGAGDIFHGAFCHYILRENFAVALAKAASVASYSCHFFGTRRWLEHHQP